MQNPCSMSLSDHVRQGIASVLILILGVAWQLPFANPQVTAPPAKKHKMVQVEPRIELPVPAHVQARRDRRTKLSAALTSAYGVAEASATEFAGWIDASAEYHSISAELLSALVMTESSFRRSARSSVGAIGPAQVRPVFWKDVCLVDLRNPADNIWCAGKILSEYRASCAGNMRCATQAYNVGPSTLSRQEFRGARRRYQAKIDRYRAQLNDHLGMRLASQ